MGEKKNHSRQGSIIRCARHCSQEKSLALSGQICGMYHHFSNLHRMNSFKWEQKLELQTVSQQDFSKNWNIFRQNYSRFPSEACWSFSPCPTEACGSWLTSWYVPEKKQKRGKEKQAITSPLSTVQTDSSMFRNHNAAHCSLFVYLNPGPRAPQALPPSLTCRQSLEVIRPFQLPAATHCLHPSITATSVFHFTGIDMIKRTMGGTRKSSAKPTYYTSLSAVTVRRREGMRHQVKFSFRPNHKCVCFCFSTVKNNLNLYAPNVISHKAICCTNVG